MFNLLSDLIQLIMSNMNKKKLLILDDDKKVCDLLERGLANDFEVITTQKSEEAYRIATEDTPDILMIDIFLKDGNGIELCESLRKNPKTKKVPILLFTGEGSVEKMLQTYEVGADDYLEKPIDLTVIRSRLKARLLRAEEMAKSSTIAAGDLKLHPDSLEVECKGELRRLSLIEFDLLVMFLAHLNQKISREEILQVVWKNVLVSERTVDVHVSSLRRKLKGFNLSIKSLYGNGYMMRPTQGEKEEV